MKDGQAMSSQGCQELVGSGQTGLEQSRIGLTVSLDERVDHQGQDANQTEGDDDLVPMGINGTNGQVALEIAHASFDVAVVLVDADHPVQIVEGGLFRFGGLIGDQHPAAIQLGGLGDLLGRS